VEHFGLESRRVLGKMRRCQVGKNQPDPSTNGWKFTVTTFQYDHQGRQRAVTSHLGHTTATTYHPDGRVHTVTAADNVVVSTRTYDALGRLATETDGENRSTTYHYDAAGRLTSYVNARNHTFSFQYDLLGRRTRRTEPDTSYQTWSYDAAGRLHQHRKADGKIKTHHHYKGTGQL
jgi:YD repeat-containing protein